MPKFRDSSVAPLLQNDTFCHSEPFVDKSPQVKLREESRWLGSGVLPLVVSLSNHSGNVIICLTPSNLPSIMLSG